MAKKSYDELRDSFQKKLEIMVKGLTMEEMFWYLKNRSTSLTDEIVEKIMAKKDLTNDERLLVVLSPASYRPSFRTTMAKDIMANSPSDKQLAQLMLAHDLLGYISDEAKEIIDDRLFAGTTIREDFEKMKLELKKSK